MINPVDGKFIFNLTRRKLNIGSTSNACHRVVDQMTNICSYVEGMPSGPDPVMFLPQMMGPDNGLVAKLSDDVNITLEVASLETGAILLRDGKLVWLGGMPTAEDLATA